MEYRKCVTCLCYFYLYGIYVYLHFIQVQTPTLTMKRHEKKNIYFRPSIPITCVSNPSRVFSLAVRMRDEAFSNCVQVKTTQCGKTIYPNEWNKTHSIEVTVADRDTFYTSERDIRLHLQSDYALDCHPMWQFYRTHDITVGLLFLCLYKKWSMRFECLFTFLVLSERRNVICIHITMTQRCINVSWNLEVSLDCFLKQGASEYSILVKKNASRDFIQLATHISRIFQLNGKIRQFYLENTWRKYSCLPHVYKYSKGYNIIQTYREFDRTV